MSELTERQKKVLSQLVHVSGRLLKLNRKSLIAMRDHVVEFGTDHEDGADVDVLVERLLREAEFLK